MSETKMQREKDKQQETAKIRSFTLCLHIDVLVLLFVSLVLIHVDLKQKLTDCSLCFMYLFRVDSIMLLENNFKVTSTDASDKMLQQAWKIRWQRRKEEAFDNWGRVTDAKNNCDTT